MEEIKIYQVYEDHSDFAGQNFIEHGYFKSLDNAIKKFNETASAGENEKIEVDLHELENNGFYTYKSKWGSYAVYGICLIQFED